MDDEDTSSASDIVRSVAKELKEPRRVRKPNANYGTVIDTVFGESLKVPQPCTTCGRPEQPERLHSHPPTETTSKVSAQRHSQIVSLPDTYSGLYQIQP